MKVYIGVLTVFFIVARRLKINLLFHTNKIMMKVKER